MKLAAYTAAVAVLLGATIVAQQYSSTKGVTMKQAIADAISDIRGRVNEDLAEIRKRGQVEGAGLKTTLIEQSKGRNRDEVKQLKAQYSKNLCLLRARVSFETESAKQSAQKELATRKECIHRLYELFPTIAVSIDPGGPSPARCAIPNPFPPDTEAPAPPEPKC